MSDQKQYYNNTQPGETSLESRTGAKVVMDNNGGIKLSSVRSKAYLDELRKNGLLQTTSQNPDEDSSYMFIGEGNVDINNQGSVNQDSLNITAETENQEANIIEPDRTEIIIASLPVEEPKPSPTPTPSPSLIPLPEDEEVVILGEANFLPSTEPSGQEQLFDNLGAGEGTGLEKNPSPAEVAQTIRNLETTTYTSNSGKSFNIVVGGSNGKSLSNDAQAILDSCYNNFAVNVAIKMNPTNYSKVINKSIPVAPNQPDAKFYKGGVIHSIIQQKYPGTYSAFCAAGTSTAFQVANKYKGAGGFPAGTSSQITWNISGVVTFINGQDYIEQKGGGKLTSSGIEKFKSILNFKGAVVGATYTTGGGKGHIGMVLGAELVGDQGYLYCLDFNLSKILKFNKKRIGGSWGIPTTRIGIAPTAQFTGGAWAPNGLSNANTYEEIGVWNTQNTKNTVFK